MLASELQRMPDGKFWYEQDPKEMLETELTVETAPLTSEGKYCPWPWEPIQLKGAPLGQYHCGYCGEMVVAGVQHLDYRGIDAAK